MTKQYQFYVPDTSPYHSRFFRPLRSGRDRIALLISILNYIGIYKSLDVKASGSHLILNVSKNSRIVLVDGSQKMFTLAFPFSISEDEQAFVLHSTDAGDLTASLLAAADSILGQNSDFGSGNVEDDDVAAFAEAVLDSTNPNVWALVKEILLSESGYMRVETDPDNEDGHIHPLHHIDLFCSQKAKVKLGLHNPVNERQFLDMLDLESDCHYLSRVG